MRHKYGQSGKSKCFTCGKQGIVKNIQGLTVCETHRKEKLGNMKCVCMAFLDLRHGKFGSYFNCINCGNVNFARGIEMNRKVDIPKSSFDPSKEKTIRSDELDFM